MQPKGGPCLLGHVLMPQRAPSCTRQTGVVDGIFLVMQPTYSGMPVCDITRTGIHSSARSFPAPLAKPCVCHSGASGYCRGGPAHGRAGGQHIMRCCGPELQWHVRSTIQGNSLSLFIRNERGAVLHCVQTLTEEMSDPRSPLPLSPGRGYGVGSLPWKPPLHRIVRCSQFTCRRGQRHSSCYGSLAHWPVAHVIG